MKSDGAGSSRYRSRASPERAAASSLWKQEIEPQEWEEFLTWKAEQAPPHVSDPFGWAYNTLKTDPERARLSLRSFRLRGSRSAFGNGPSDAPDFEAWERERHVELAQQYAANTVTFLRQQSWHASWVEYVNAHLPALFAEVYEGDP